MKILKWFTEKKWFKNNVKGMKAVYYKKEVLGIRVSDSLPTNYAIAKKLFEGFFGNAAYKCDELMVCYKISDVKLDESEYAKLTSSFYNLGFRLHVASRDDGNYMVGLFADQNIMTYITDKSLRIGKFNIESLNYIT